MNEQTHGAQSAPSPLRRHPVMVAAAAICLCLGVVLAAVSADNWTASAHNGVAIATVSPASVGLRSFSAATANATNAWAPTFQLQAGDEFTFAVDTSGTPRVMQQAWVATPGDVALVQTPSAPHPVQPGTVFVGNAFATGASTVSVPILATDTSNTVQMWLIKEGPDHVLDPLGLTPVAGPTLVAGERVAAVSPRSIEWDDYHWAANTVVTIKVDGTLTQYQTTARQGGYSSSVIVAPPGQGPAGFAAAIDSMQVAGQDVGGYMYTWQFNSATSGLWNLTALLANQATWTNRLTYEDSTYPNQFGSGAIPVGIFVPNYTTGSTAATNPNAYVMLNSGGAISIATGSLAANNLWTLTGTLALDGADDSGDVGYGSFNVNASPTATAAYYQLAANGNLALYDAASGQPVPGGVWNKTTMYPQNLPAVGTLAACDCYAGYASFVGITAAGNLAFYGPHASGGYDSAVISDLPFQLATPVASS